eukprot:CAMPEP_0118689026 /NCGR_PEP_ID=MMETSP0800-20121206/9247_1 /TAXON_ID=210618 ORGANISM="Striatella unipunctata, Strain CCMP2910" /NCGR_SAMPLE_ID=MMETSP0800 /ASSEMBLY_ACC=CAM_ASM_000638 /LENGTH=193 /DNA_ID=CAMNT_0006586351 /DNA_START=143 /DNA_END=724 /DNA_ORIENTATION=-
MLETYGRRVGHWLLFMLGPSVVSFGFDVYNRRKLVSKNAAQVAAAVSVSSLGGLCWTAAMVRWLNIASPSVRLGMLSRSNTAPLAVSIANQLLGDDGGSDLSLAIAIVVVTGVLGASFGKAILDACGIQNPVARGLGIGSASHGLGTSSLKNEPDAFPFGAIGMALTASASTILVYVPFIRKAISAIALGNDF